MHTHEFSFENIVFFVNLLSNLCWGDRSKHRRSAGRRGQRGILYTIVVIIIARRGTGRVRQAAVRDAARLIARVVECAVHDALCGRVCWFHV